MNNFPYIVNVGLPLTGSAAFISAVELLGFPSLHVWREAEVNQDLFERATLNRPRPAAFIQKFGALADTPFYAMRRTFEEHYPATHLIYTTCDKDAWLARMISHSTAGGKFLMGMYDLPHYPHQETSRQALSAAFDTHHAEVCRGLTEIRHDMSDREKWEITCRCLPNSRRLLRKTHGLPWPDER